MGFTPFELVFGHNVRGPLKLVKEKWLDSEEKMDLLSYVTTFKDRLANTCTMASKHLEQAQSGMKTWYDKKAKTRSFKAGDKVLILMPMPGNALQAKYMGPYLVEKRMSELVYAVITPDRRKSKQICHINMLKPFYDREQIVAGHKNDKGERESKSDEVKPVLPFDTVEMPPTTQDFQLSECGPALKNSNVLENLESEKLSHLSLSQQVDIVSLVNEYSHIFSDVPKKIKTVIHDILLTSDVPVKQHPYRLNPEKQQALDKEIKYMLDNDIIKRGNSVWSSPCILVPKPDKSFRLCTDFRKVNDVTKTDTYPLPRIEDCIDSVGKARYVTKLDMLKGFWQVPLSERAKEISAFTTPSGLYRYKVLPFGLKNAPPTYQRLMNRVIAGLNNVKVYIDDVIVNSSTSEAHIRSISLLLSRLSEFNLTVNLVKSEFGKATVTFLGHVVGQGKVLPIDAKVQGINNFQPPADRKGIMRFLEMAGFNREFCKNFADLAAPLTNLLSKGVKFKWSIECQKAFEQLKPYLLQHLF